MKFTSFYTLLLLGAGASLHAQTFVGTAPANRNALLEELTGIHCQYCPDGHRIANQIYNANPSRVVLVNVHAGGYATPTTGELDFRTSFGSTYDNYLYALAGSGNYGYPTGVVNRHDFDTTNNALDQNRGAWQTSINSILAMSSPVNVAARCTINVTTRQMRMAVEAYYTGNGNGATDRFNAFIIQDNIAGTQTAGATYNPSQVLPNGKYNHQHALRALLTPIWGDTITSNTQGSLFSKTYNYTIPAAYTSIPALIPDLEFVVFVADSIKEVYTANHAEIAYESNETLTVANISASLAEAIVCGTTVSPTVKYMNYGNTPITSVTVQYSVNSGATSTHTHTLTNAVALGEYIEFDIPNIPIATGNNSIALTITELNGQTFAGTTQSVTVSPAVNKTSVADSAILSITFDRYASETSFTLTDATTNTVVLTRSGFGSAQNSQTLRFAAPLVSGHCYSFKINDSAADGICCGYGNGSFALSLKDADILLTGGNFGSSASTKFNWTQQPVGVQHIASDIQSINVYPNPANDLINVAVSFQQNADAVVEITNALGQAIRSINTGNLLAGTHTFQLSTSDLANGTYFVTVRNNGTTSTSRFTVIR